MDEFYPRKLPKPIWLMIVLSLGLSLVTACGDRTGIGPKIDTVATACQPGTVQIQVWDGLLQIMCGCVGANEAPGTIFNFPAPLTCTLPSSSAVVFFYFQGTVLQHQIIPVGTNKFVATPVNNPRNGANFPAIGVTFPNSGTYQFMDAFSGMTGQIIVP